MYAGHHRLAFAMNGRPNPETGQPICLDDELASLSEEIRSANARYGIISSEELYACPKESIIALSKAIDDVPVTIIAFVRSSDDFFLSSYNERMKKFTNNFIYSIEEMVDNKTLWPKEMFFKKNMTNWTDVFSDQQAIIHPYEGHNPLKILLNDMGINSLIKIPELRVNTSKPAKAIAIIRLLKLANWPMQDRENVCEALFEAFKGDMTPMLSKHDRERILKENDTELSGLFEELNAPNPYMQSMTNIAEIAGRSVTEIPLPELIQEAEEKTGIDLSMLRAAEEKVP
jgi:hypothetical protein